MGASPELVHVATARKYIGTVEIKGSKHNQKITDWIKAAEKGTKQNLSWLFGKNSKGATNYNDEVAWCGSFLAGVFTEIGLVHKIPKNFFRAADWATVGTKLNKPAYGCVVTFSRTGGGHVGLVVGVTKSGMLKVLGGNQSDAVNISDFDPRRVTSYRWLSSGTAPHEHRYQLPVLPAGRISTNEA